MNSSEQHGSHSYQEHQEFGKIAPRSGKDLEFEEKTCQKPGKTSFGGW